ncbi:MAG TPA: SUF system Fe-S cluster assembly regulator [Candidatus Eisenbacteria bacterium]|nr:SUF system Fe-S cluster assembly regulator [Candidatus Eisenbacteria bacterium]
MLRITKQSDYGIVLMTLFAGDGRERVHSTRDLASLAKLPLPTVSKILKALARAGLLQSHRGVKGGYRLARLPEDISVEEIIRALEGPIAITECVDEDGMCEIEGSCPVRTNWQRINGAVRDALASIRLSEMAAGMAFGGPPARNGRPMTEAPREVEAS